MERKNYRNRTYYWLIPVFFWTFVFVYAFGSCSDTISTPKKETKNQEEKVEKLADKSVTSSKYLYIDSAGVSHINLDCHTMYDILGAHQGVRRVLLDEASEKVLEYCCRECISDKDYDSLKVFIQKGKKRNNTKRIVIHGIVD